MNRKENVYFALIYWTDHEFEGTRESVNLYNLTDQTIQSMRMGDGTKNEWGPKESHSWEGLEQILCANNGKTAELLEVWSEYRG